MGLAVRLTNITARENRETTMRVKAAHTFLKPALMWMMIIAYVALGDVQVNQMIAMTLP